MFIYAIIFMSMSSSFNWKPYCIGVLIVALLSCIINWRIGLGIILGSIYFYLNDKLNQKKFPHLDSKLKVTGSLFLIILLQFMMICGIALLSYRIGGLYSFFGAFAGMTIPHFYFIIVELTKIKK